ncbi:hypothetical protein HNY73_006127 [Argiope bruennichi]|uniref:Uncharacterized protein n=1 Tax=Argiope bruennichi TaxID=94029 RepID=A0A8T0FIY3_ARGBR|nr:hypothetical protein HNY73_006127 [Argiope bruennichi]
MLHMRLNDSWLYGNVLEAALNIFPSCPNTSRERERGYPPDLLEAYHIDIEIPEHREGSLGGTVLFRTSARNKAATKGQGCLYFAGDKLYLWVQRDQEMEFLGIEKKIRCIQQLSVRAQKKFRASSLEEGSAMAKMFV